MQGACVSNEHYLSRILSRSHGLNAVNVGTASNAPNHYYALIKTFAALHKPKTIILHFYPNDNINIPDSDVFFHTDANQMRPAYNRRGISEQGYRFYAATSAMLMADKGNREALPPNGDQTACADRDPHHRESRTLIKQTYFDYRAVVRSASLVAFWRELSRPRTIDLVQLNNVASLLSQLFHILAPKNGDANLPMATKMAIDELMIQCQSLCEPMIVLLPNSDFWRVDSRASEYFASIQEYVHKKYSHINYRFLDARTLVDPTALVTFAPAGPHYSVEGYNSIAEGLARAIRAKK